MPLVDSRTIADVVADWTGIPVGKMMKDEVEAVLQLADTLKQTHHWPTSRLGCNRPSYPNITRESR